MEIFTIFIIVASCIFGLILAITLINKITVARYKRHKDFGYNPEKKQKTVTGIPIIDKIIELNPGFMSNEIEKTNLCKTNRVDTDTGQQISLAETIKRYPEEQIRLECYYKCLRRFGKERVDLEFPIHYFSSKKYLDVVVFHAESKENPMLSKEHNVLNLAYVFECKKNHTNPDNKLKNGQPETMDYIMRSGLEQLKQYMGVCPNLVEKEIPELDPKTKQPTGKTIKKIFGLGCLTNGISTAFYKRYTDAMTGNPVVVQVPTPSWYEKN